RRAVGGARLGGGPPRRRTETPRDRGVAGGRNAVSRVAPGANLWGYSSMLGAFRSADAGPRGAATRIGLAALLACIGLTWTAGATAGVGPLGTVEITEVHA